MIPEVPSDAGDNTNPISLMSDRDFITTFGLPANVRKMELSYGSGENAYIGTVEEALNEASGCPFGGWLRKASQMGQSEVIGVLASLSAVEQGLQPILEATKEEYEKKSGFAEAP